ncbi:hypothetical protein L1887_21134 [Cichorium endivia]|nr:hypothetical protein L1887_21134 [Cichorium endivia]
MLMRQKPPDSKPVIENELRGANEGTNGFLMLVLATISITIWGFSFVGEVFIMWSDRGKYLGGATRLASPIGVCNRCLQS